MKSKKPVTVHGGLRDRFCGDNAMLESLHAESRSGRANITAVR
jgi:hypothetical protein